MRSFRMGPAPQLQGAACTLCGGAQDAQLEGTVHIVPSFCSKSLAGLVRSVPCHDAAIEGQDLGFQCQQLSPESSQAGACYLWQPSVVGIGDDFEQLLDITTPDRCDDPELGQVRANGIDDGRLLANEQMAGAMKRQMDD
jgi:hypothetical protein